MNANVNSPPSVEPGPGAATTHDLDRLIATHPFLKGLSPHHQRLLASCAMLVRFEAGEQIFREGDPANRFYLIQKGKVSLESSVPEQGITHVQTIGAGDVLGWSWLFPPYFWQFDARALEPTEAVFFYATPLRTECEADHDLGYELLRRMADVLIKRLQAVRRKLIGTNPGPI